MTGPLSPEELHKMNIRIDTPGEAAYYRHGGIMQYVLRTLLARA